jgi:penicillin-binding protein 1C
MKWPSRAPTHARRVAVVGALTLVALCTSLLSALLITSYRQPLPSALLHKSPQGQRILDRHGQLLARRMNQDQVFAVHLPLEAAGPHLVDALVAAEDQRFFHHPGIDPIAMARALISALRAGRINSGASTITQQLARTTFARPRTLAGKWQEMALALRIERHFEKRQILELYLNRVHFGPKLVGAQTAAEHYFGKPLSALDLSETATLVGLLRGPSVFDPTRYPARALKQRDRVLHRLLEHGTITLDQSAAAKELPLTLRPAPPLPGARHWVRLLARTQPAPTVRSTLLGALQRQVEALVAARHRALDAHHSDTTAVAVVVLDNSSGDVLAYVGSADFKNSRDFGENDGVLALRQPGSALKPFLYAQAIDELGFDPTTLLPDEPQHFKAGQHFYAPRNFDRKFRGQVRLRRALSNSLNVPAVYTVDKLGTHHVLTKLRQLGLRTLEQSAEHYGPALALGDGEVTLLDLTSGYAALARGGVTIEPRWTIDAPVSTTKRVFSAEAAAMMSEMLSDDASRREAFGAINALDLPFPVAVKTGTSKGYRDTWTVGYTRGISVGVWAGNFDGRPTDRMTGASAAGPLFRAVFMSVARLLGGSVTAPGRTRPLHDVPLVEQRVCADGDPWILTDCKHTLVEWLPSDRTTSTATRGAIQATMDDRQPDSTAHAPTIAYPKSGMVFSYDPAVAEHRQKLLFKLDRSSRAAPTTLYLNGQALAAVAGQAEWTVQPGDYELYAEAMGKRSDVVQFVVR